MAQRTGELLTAEELAERLRVQPATIRVWAREGRIPRLRISAKVIRFDPIAVVEVLRQRQKSAATGD